VGRWYTEKSARDLAYQVTKYRQRKGWTHRDVLRSAHPRPGGLSKRELQIVARLGDMAATLNALAESIGVDVANTTRLVNRLFDRGLIWDDEGALRLSEAGQEVLAQRTVFDFVSGRYREGTLRAPELLDVYLTAQRSPSPPVTADLVRDHRALAWEMLPSDHLKDPVVWEALLEQGMPMTALLRNLPRLTRLGLLPQGHARTHAVVQQLTDVERLRKARVHPMAVLIALRTYASGHSVRGDSTWAPTPQITNALDAAFYAAFGTVEPTGQRILLAVDVSGSMRTHYVAGIPMSAHEAAAAMTMVTVATEPHVDVVGFTGTLEGGRYGSSWGWNTVATASEALTPLDLSPRRRLDDIMAYMSRLPFGGTDCALPWTWALEQGREYDAILTFTDNETWQGPVHVHQAQRAYRDRTGLPTRSVAAAFTATDYTVNDPADLLSLDIAGLDSNVPNLISDFVAGRV
jgi:60 kDa SS-A/Ro ribonucleoprotein